MYTYDRNQTSEAIEDLRDLVHFDLPSVQLGEGAGEGEGLTMD